MSSSLAKPNEIADPSGGQQVDAFFVRQLQRASSQIKLIDLITGMAQVAVATLAGLLVVCVLDAWIVPLPAWFRIGVLFGLVGYGLFVFARHLIPLFLWRINPAYAARMIEHSSPGLKNSLLNYLFLRGLPAAQRSAVYSAVRQRAAQDLSAISIESSVDRGRLIRIGFALVGVVLAAGMYKLLSPKDPVQTLRRVFAPLADVPAPSRVQVVRVEPGSVDLFFGEPLEVRAEIRGASGATNPVLVFSSDDGQHVNATLPLNATDRRYEYTGVLGPTAGGIRQSLTYWVAAGDGRSSDYRVRVRPAPTIAVTAVELLPPAYTELPPVTREGIGDVEGIEGSRVRVTATANMPVASAYLEFLRVRPRDGEAPLEFQTLDRLAMESSEDEARGEFQLPRLGNAPPFTHYRIRFSSSAGQTSSEGSAYAIKIRPDIAPELTVEQPAQPEVQVPLGSNFPIVARASDPDFQLSSIWLYVAHKGKLLLQQNLPLEPKSGIGNVTTRFQLRPDALGLKAGDEAVLYLIAKDNRHAPSGEFDANQTRSGNYTLRIVAGQPGDRSKPNPAGGNASGDSPPQPNAEGDQPNEQPDDNRAPGDNSGQASEGNDAEAGDEQNAEGNSGSKSSQQNSDDQQSGDSSQSGAGNMTAGGGEGDNQSTQPAEQGGGAEGNSASQADSQSSSGQSSGSQPADKPSPSAAPSSAQSSAQSDPSSQSTPGESTAADESNNPSSGDSSADGEEARDDNAPLNNFSSDGERMQRLLRRAEDQNQRPERNETRSEGGIDDPNRDPDGNQASGNQAAGATPPKNPNASGRSAAGEQNSQPGAPQPGAQGERNPSENSTDANSGSDPQPNERNQSSAGNPADPKSSENRSPNGERDPTDPPSQPGKNPGDSQAGNPDASNPDESNRSASNSGANRGEKQGQPGEPTSENAGQSDRNEPGAADPQNQSTEAQSDSTAGKSETDPRPNAGDESPMGEQNSSRADPSSDAASQQPSGNQGSRDDENRAADGQPQPSEENAPSAADPKSASQPAENNTENEPSTPENPGENSGENSGESTSGQAPSNAQRPSSSSAAKSAADRGSPTGEQAPPTTAPQNREPSGARGEPQQSGAGSEFNPTHDDPTEKEILETSRQATELVLDYLRDQQHQPDPSLLNEMNWTESEMRAFLQRWETMRAEAERGNTAAAKKFEESLRSLGLRPQQSQIRRNRMQSDAIENLNEDSAVSRPPSGRDAQFREFMRRRSQAENQ